MKFVSTHEKILNKAFGINEVLKIGVVAIDNAFRENREIKNYDTQLFKDINPDNYVTLENDQAILYEFKSYSALEVCLSLFHSMNINYADFLEKDSGQEPWEKLTHVVGQLKERPIYFIVKNDC